MLTPISYKQEKSLYFAEKCYDIHRRTPFGGRNETLSLHYTKRVLFIQKLFNYLSNSRLGYDKETSFMHFCSTLSRDWKTTVKTGVGALSLFLFATIATDTAAITAQTVMENALKVYENIDDYSAVVYTYKADAMDVSESIFDAQQPIVAFNLFFRQPDEHAIQEIGQSRHGIFRIELLSALGTLKDLDVVLQGKALVRGQECHVLEVSSIERPQEMAKLWISPKDWTVRQFSISVASVEMIVTQFKHARVGRRQILPIETRSFFPLTKLVYINRITDYKINIGLGSELFEKREAK